MLCNWKALRDHLLCCEISASCMCMWCEYWNCLYWSFNFNLKFYYVVVINCFYPGRFLWSFEDDFLQLVFGLLKSLSNQVAQHLLNGFPHYQYHWNSSNRKSIRFLHCVLAKFKIDPVHISEIFPCGRRSVDFPAILN